MFTKMAQLHRGTAIALRVYSPQFAKESRHNSVENESEQLTVREVSEMLHVSPATVYKLISEGRIPTFRIGTEWGFQRDQIVHWIAEQTMNAFS
jgi:excisionase family DNA binding protein